MKFVSTISTVVLCLATAPVLVQAADELAATNTIPPWDISATVGLTLTRGNSKTLLASGNLQGVKKWYKNELDLGVDGVYGENNDTKSAESIRGYGQYNRLFTERFFGYMRVEGLHDAIADIKYRVTLSPGAGYYFIKTANTGLRGEVGPGYVFEKVGNSTHDYATLRLAERFDQKLNDRAKIWESVEFLPQVDKFSNYVINSEIGLETSITKKLSQVAFIQDTYRSEPAPGRLKNDIKLIAGLKYKF